jgi:hypothetical protein
MRLLGGIPHCGLLLKLFAHAHEHDLWAEQMGDFLRRMIHTSAERKSRNTRFFLSKKMTCSGIPMRLGKIMRALRSNELTTGQELLFREALRQRGSE